jgi:23S rRNA (adenine2503-C2)-methyltransferase
MAFQPMARGNYHNFMKFETEKQDITELSRQQLVQWFETRRMQGYRADQVMRWIYTRKACSFDQMTNIARTVQDELARHFIIGELLTDDIQTAPDGTRKFSFCLTDRNRIESVLIEEKDHHTLCISTQVGCAMECRFCLTGKNGLVRNLTPGEITGQIRAVEKVIAPAGNNPEKPLTNIVLMGMGEPLANYDNVMQALDIATDGENGLKLAARRITLSTVGIVPRILALGKDRKFKLAISLNATENELRSHLMPINRKYPIEVLLEACKSYDRQHRDRITFEYVLIKGVNDSPAEARKLARLLSVVRAKINLIPYNPHEGSDFERPENASIEAFHTILLEKHCTAMIRWSKGEEISAACGQLAYKGTIKNGTEPAADR